MKVLFLIFHGFEEFNGISKKIRYQIKALQDCGAQVDICWLDDTNGQKRRMINDTILQDYGNGFKGKILKRTGLDCIVNYIKTNSIDLVYVRSDHNTTPFLINCFKKIKQLGVKIVMEIPTYPYDQEYKDLGLSYQHIIIIDKCLRKYLFKHIDKVVTFSNHPYIFNKPTIRIANGIDFDSVTIKKEIVNDGIINLIAVATVHPWHGFDRAIKGMINYKQRQSEQPVVLHIVGQGVPEVMNSYHKLVEENQLENYVIFHGPLFGEKLDTLFNMSQMGIGSLARHRSGITHLRSLKNREYAARGIPFVYSEIDDDFETMPYILKATTDETALDIKQVIDFYKSLNIDSMTIRNSIQSLSWKEQMNKVLKEVQ